MGFSVYTTDVVYGSKRVVAGTTSTITSEISYSIIISGNSVFNTKPLPNLKFEGKTIQGIAGEALSTMNLVTMLADGKWYNAKCSSTNLSQGMLGIASISISLNSTGSIILPYAMTRNDSWTFTTGNRVYVDYIGGGYTQTSTTTVNSNIRTIGYATGGNYLYFDPSKEYIQYRLP